MNKPLQATTYTFRDIIEGNFLYIDKTRYLYELVRYSKGAYFLSRPRRFGKSLLLSTLSDLFQGEQALFEGLWIYESDYEWESYPIIHIDFGLSSVKSHRQLINSLQELLEEIAAQHNLTLNGSDFQGKLRSLVYQLADIHNGKVVLLVDEYDKPIVDNLNDIEEAKSIRDTLRAFYGVVKALDRYWRFVFVTGISKFSRVGVFSTMNNLDDLTMDYRFANALGITEDELEHYFHSYLAEFAQKLDVTPQELLEQIGHWYDGFRFTAEGENLYNPYSTIQLFRKQRFSNYWFATGTPNFLIQLLRDNEYDIGTLDKVQVDEIAFETYELNNLAIIPLLFQTGYLTIKGFTEDEYGEIYELSYPNYEVKHAFVTYLLNAYNGGDITLTDNHLRRLLRALHHNSLDEFFETLNIFFANIDYDLHLENEKYYQTIFYMIFLLLGLNVTAETKTNAGRIDAVVELDNKIYIFEFKLNQSASVALQQTKDKAYAEKYRLHNKPITLVGASYLFKERKVTDWTYEPDKT